MLVCLYRRGIAHGIAQILLWVIQASLIQLLHYVFSASIRTRACFGQKVMNHPVRSGPCLETVGVALVQSCWKSRCILSYNKRSINLDDGRVLMLMVRLSLVLDQEGLILVRRTLVSIVKTAAMHMVGWVYGAIVLAVDHFTTAQGSWVVYRLKICWSSTLIRYIDNTFNLLCGTGVRYDFYIQILLGSFAVARAMVFHLNLKIW